MSFTLMHLSDLHFYDGFLPGVSKADENQLWTALETTKQQINPDFTVITGDFISTPKKKTLERVKGKLDALFKDNYFVMPGNHDLRILGFMGRLWLQKPGKVFRDVFSNRAEPDHYIQKKLGKWNGILFVPIDTMANGHWARGIAPRDELIQKLTKSARNHPQALKVALIHHAPLPTLSFKPRKGEHLTLLEDAGALIRQLADLDYDLVLHGHDHNATLYSLALPGKKPLVICGAASPLVDSRDAGFFTYRIDESGAIMASCYEYDEKLSKFVQDKPDHIHSGSGPLCIIGDPLAAPIRQMEHCIVLQCDIVGFRNKPKVEVIKALAQAISELQRLKIGPDIVQQMSDEFLLCYQNGGEKQPAKNAMVAAAHLLNAGELLKGQVRIGIDAGTVETTGGQAWNIGATRSVLVGQPVVRARCLGRIGQGGYVILSNAYKTAFELEISESSLAAGIDQIPNHENGSDSKFVICNTLERLFWTKPVKSEDGRSFSLMLPENTSPPLRGRLEYSKFSRFASGFGHMSYLRGQNPNGKVAGLRFACKEIQLDGEGGLDVYVLLIFEGKRDKEEPCYVPIQTDGRVELTSITAASAVVNKTEFDPQNIFLKNCREHVALLDQPLDLKRYKSQGVWHIRVPINLKTQQPNEIQVVLLNFKTKGGLDASFDFASFDLTDYETASNKVEIRIVGPDPLPDLGRAWGASGVGIEMLPVNGDDFNKIHEINRFPFKRARVDQNYRYCAVEVR